MWKLEIIQSRRQVLLSNANLSAELNASEVDKVDPKLGLGLGKTLGTSETRKRWPSSGIRKHDRQSGASRSQQSQHVNMSRPRGKMKAGPPASLMRPTSATATPTLKPTGAATTTTQSKGVTQGQGGSKSALPVVTTATAGAAPKKGQIQSKFGAPATGGSSGSIKGRQGQAKGATSTTSTGQVPAPAPLTEAEIQRLGRRFQKLDKDKSGTISLAEFRSIPELKNNPLVDRVVAIFDMDKNGEVDFQEFIKGMSQFTNSEDRQRFAFRIFDVDNDGFVSPGELYQVVKILCGNNLTPTQMQQLVDHTYIICDTDNDGRISYKEFCAAIKNTSFNKPRG